MKINFTNGLAALLLFTTITACSKEDPATQKDKESIFTLTFDYDERTYVFGETIDVTLTVTTNNTSDDHFVLSARCFGGPANILSDEGPLEADKKYDVFYEIVNTSGSSRVLHFHLTPRPNDSADRTLSLEIDVASIDGSSTASGQILIPLKNNEVITASVQKDRDPIESQETVSITLSATKQGFTGSFSVTPHLTGCDGYFLSGDQVIHNESPFPLKATEPSILEYQPRTLGPHTLSFTITDKISTVEVSVKLEVYSQTGLTYPKDGVYIYAKQYNRSPFFTRDEWTSSVAITPMQPEGIAIITPKSKFLIPNHYVSGVPMCLKDDDYSKIEGFPFPKNAFGDYDGKGNTKKIVDAKAAGIIQKADIAIACYYYDPENPGRWYLPASGQLDLIKTYYDEVFGCMELVHCDILSMDSTVERYYYSSSGFRGAPYFWALRAQSYRVSLDYGNGTYTHEDYCYFPVMDL